ncbi:MAG: glutamyl-tRNA reductase [Deltaproteobacteria bacterium]|nr:glutamyl-tRNA reductase [Deltaproteobacteria bacterium]
MKILLIGMNHRTAPLEVRERYAAIDAGPALRKLVMCDEIEEAVLVSTCNRVDLVVTTQRVEDAVLRVHRFFRTDLTEDDSNVAGQSLEDVSYEHRGSDAVRHVFRVASSLDSMVIGEPQILGQMKDAYRFAVENKVCGPVLSRLFQRAFATAKRVKNETRIAQRPVSVARVAVDFARQIFEDMGDKTALLLGAGEMIELSLFALQRDGLGGVRVVNRTLAHAEELASRFSATPHHLDELESLLPEADVVLSCVGGDQPILGMGVPRNVDPRVEELDNAYVYDMDDLQSVADANAGERRRESNQGEEIVGLEQLQFDNWVAALKAVPTIRHLRARAEMIRTKELERMSGRLGLNEAQREGVEALTRGIVNKLLHAPLTHLRNETESEADLGSLEAARSLFALDDEAAPGAEADAALHREMERNRLLDARLAEFDASDSGHETDEDGEDE